MDYNLLDDAHLYRLIIGSLHYSGLYDFIYNGKRVMYVDGSYGRVNIEDYFIRKLPFGDKVSLMQSIAKVCDL